MTIPKPGKTHVEKATSAAKPHKLKPAARNIGFSAFLPNTRYPAPTAPNMKPAISATGLWSIIPPLFFNPVSLLVSPALKALHFFYGFFLCIKSLHYILISVVVLSFEKPVNR